MPPAEGTLRYHEGRVAVAASGSETTKEARTGLEPWNRGELPPPPDTRGLKLLGVVGPGAIVLGAAIGSGEWLIGPTVFVRYGLSLLWVTLLGAGFQALFNTELVRYTLYTGEPAFTGFMRTRPHSTFWAWVYAGLYFLQNGWPAWAGASAGALFFLIMGRAAGVGESGTLYAVGLGLFAVCVVLLLFGGARIERTLEILNWVLVSGIFLILGALCLAFAGPRGLVVSRRGLRGVGCYDGEVPTHSRWGRLVSRGGLRGVLGLRRRHEHNAFQLGPGQGVRHGRRRGLHPYAGRRARSAPRPRGNGLRARRHRPPAVEGVVAHRSHRPVGDLLRRSPPGDGSPGHSLHRPHSAWARTFGG